MAILTVLVNQEKKISGQGQTLDIALLSMLKQKAIDDKTYSKLEYVNAPTMVVKSIECIKSDKKIDFTIQYRDSVKTSAAVALRPYVLRTGYLWVKHLRDDRFEVHLYEPIEQKSSKTTGRPDD